MPLAKRAAKPKAGGWARPGGPASLTRWRTVAVRDDAPSSSSPPEPAELTDPIHARTGSIPSRATGSMRRSNGRSPPRFVHPRRPGRKPPVEATGPLPPTFVRPGWATSSTASRLLEATPPLDFPDAGRAKSRAMSSATEPYQLSRRRWRRSFWPPGRAAERQKGRHRLPVRCDRLQARPRPAVYAASGRLAAAG